MCGTIHNGAFTASTRKNSFKAVGIHPFDPNIILKRLPEKQQKLIDDQQLIQSLREKSSTITPESQKIDTLFSVDIVPVEPSPIHQALRFVHNVDNQNLLLEDITRVKSSLSTYIEQLDVFAKLLTRKTEVLRAHNRCNVKNNKGKKKHSGPGVLSLRMAQRTVDIKSKKEEIEAARKDKKKEEIEAARKDKKKAIFDALEPLRILQTIKEVLWVQVKSLKQHKAEALNYNKHPEDFPVLRVIAHHKDSCATYKEPKERITTVVEAIKASYDADIKKLEAELYNFVHHLRE